jgi:hypothetical protein
MISVFGMTLGAAAPWFLVGVPLAASLLVYIFRARGSAHDLVISTLFLIRNLPQRLSARKTFAPPLQFWLELAALSLLSLAAAGLLATDSRQRIAVVIDTSLSMGAINEAGQTRLETAQRIASADVSQFLVQGRFSVYGAASELLPASEPLISAPVAALAINSLKPTYLEDNLNAQIRSLLLQGSFDKIWLYTDRTLKDQSVPFGLRVTTIPTTPLTERNIWIRSLSADTDQTITIEISSLAPSEISIQVAASCFSADGAELSAPTPISIKLSPVTTNSSQIGPIDPTWAFCRITSYGDDTKREALEIDNEGWIARADNAPAIQIVSPLSLQELGLTGLKGFQFQRIESPQATNFNKTVPTIFHRTTTSSEMQAPSLVISPPAGALPWGGAVVPQILTAPPITRWIQSHPLLRYVNPTLLSIERAAALRCPESSLSIILSSSGVLACAGESEGFRYLVTGFEIFPFEGLSTPSITVLTLNAFKWLFNSATPLGAINLGRSIFPSGAKELRSVMPLSAAPLLTDSNVVMINTPGVVSYRSEKDSTPKFLAFNLFSDQESDLARAQTISIEATTQGASLKQRAPLALASWLALLALLVLLIDIAIRIKRSSSWRAR